MSGMLFNLLFYQQLPCTSQLRGRTGIRNALDLHGHALGQLLDRNAASRRLMREELDVGVVHFGKVSHIVKEDVDLVVRQHCRFHNPCSWCYKMYLDDSVNADTSLGKNGLDVVTALLGLVANAALSQLAL